MLSLRPYLGRPPRIRLQTLRPRVRLRRQHDNHGPHKEYFQHPSQYPTNVQTTPATPLPYIPQSTIAHAVAQTAAQPKQPGPIRRGIRNFTLVLLSSMLGYTAGAAIITWEYMQPPYERGSEEYTEMQEEIDEILEDAPICEQLRRDNWFEYPITRSTAPANASQREHQHLVNDTLSGVQGFTMKQFRHPKLEISMLVFFSGFGIDGFPDTVHGGAISSIMMEAHNKHVEPVVKENDLEVLPYSESHVGFTQMVKPGNTYAVLIVSNGWGTGYVEGGDQDFIVNNADAFLYDMDAVTVEEKVVLDELGLPRPGAAVDMQGVQHAIAKLNMCLSSNKVVREEGESREEYIKRLDQVAENIVKKGEGAKG